jgi:predicted nucleic acid-binding protein
MREIVIVNTSPLFYLHRLGYLHLLQKLYNGIVIPSAVVNELEEGKRLGEDVPQIEDYKWINIRHVAVPLFIKIVPDLGQGEAEVLALSCEHKNSLLIIDDGLARKIAKLYTFKITGTAGVLLKAKQEKHISDIKPVLKKLKDVGFYLSDNLISNILKIAGED